MDTTRKKIRIAMRKFPPFERAIKKQWAIFEAKEGSALELEVVALDLLDLTEALFNQRGLQNGTFDVALINTDWIASACERGDLLDIAPFLRSDPPDDYPNGWSDSMLRLQMMN